MCFLLYRSARRKGDYQDREIVFEKIFLFTPCILSGKLYNELKRKPFVKCKFNKR
jgi:hypothetical protein